MEIAKYENSIIVYILRAASSLHLKQSPTLKAVVLRPGISSVISDLFEGQQSSATKKHGSVKWKCSSKVKQGEKDP